ncbi:helix-turn-helix domain-containing protein [Cronobacter turicensis]
MDAYGLTIRKASVDHLGVSKSMLVNRYMKDTFSADLITEIALETVTV